VEAILLLINQLTDQILQTKDELSYTLMLTYSSIVRLLKANEAIGQGMLFAHGHVRPKSYHWPIIK